MLSFLADNLTIVTLMGLTVVVLGLLALVVWAAIVRDRERSESGKTQAPRLGLETIKQSFRSAVELIEQNIAARSERYNVPWALVINEAPVAGAAPNASDAAASSMLPLVSSGIPSALSSDAILSTAALGIEWNFFDQGVALQLRGEFLGDVDQPEGPQRSWDDLLGLCQKYRPDRPFDALILTLPANLLLGASPDALAAITARARALHRRLWLAQNRFALRFPVYLVVSGTEEIPGFKAFGQALPEHLRGSMLGWSNPNELAAPYHSAWADVAVDTVIESVSRACDELAALEPAGQDSVAYFLLPAELERLRKGMQVFLDEFMRPSTYHEPFMLRGLYLCGDVSQGDYAQPVFMRDVFERKVFPEMGLVRAASVQRTRRTALRKTSQWATASVLVVWALGLAWSTHSLERTVRELSSAVTRLDRDTVESLQSLKMSAPNTIQARDRAVDALTLITQVDAGSLGSVFMPGSWRWFDDLGERVQKRLEQRFSENSFIPIRRSLYAQVAELSGVALDTATGEIIQGAACDLPSTWKDIAGSSGAAAGIALEDQAELKAVLAFMARADLLEKVVAARQRLVEGRDAPSTSDLKIIVNLTLGTELTGNAERTAELFRRYSRGLPPLQVEVMRAALSCSFTLAMAQLHRRVLDDNPLLLSEQNLVARFAEFSGGTDVTADSGKMRELLLGILEEMLHQESMMQPGKGSWMNANAPALGTVHDNLLQRATANALIGASTVDALQQTLRNQFAQFKANWTAAVNTNSAGLAGSLVWSDKEARWMFSDARAGLRNGLSALMGQGYMQALSRRSLPSAIADKAYAWDIARLEQAAALSDVRRRYETEVLAKFPEALRPEIDRVGRAALAETLIDLTAQALVPVPASSASLGELERNLLGRIRVQLMDLGASGAATQLVGLLSQDAVTRLRLLDDAWASAEPYALPERGFDTWQGERPPMLEALGLEDAAALAAYSAHQNSRIMQLAKEAEVILAALEVAGKNGVRNLRGGEALVQKWRSIVSDVERHRNRSAASSLSQLEQFVTVTTAELDLNNCGDKLLARSVSRRGQDPFVDRLRRLHGDLLQRCRSLRIAELKSLWSSFREHYNRDIAGRSPFALAHSGAVGRIAQTATSMPVSAAAPMGAPARSPLQVDEVSSLLRAFDRIRVLMKDRLMEPGGRHVAGTALQQFTQQFDAMRQFMLPLLVNEDGATQAYDVWVELRSNTTDEIDGNKFIDWSLAIGSQRQSLRDPVKPLRWLPGDPIELSLRAAKNGPITPLSDPSMPGMTVEDMVVRIQFQDLWALMSLLHHYRDPDHRATDQRVSMLRLDIPVNRRVDSVAERMTGKARLYVRLTVSPPGKRSALAWPSNVPSKAPEWGTP